MFLNEEFLNVYEELNPLNEWVDKDGNKIESSTSSNTVTSPASSGAKTMKERFTSLLYYIKRNKVSTVTKAEVTRLQDTGFDYQEERTKASGYTYTYLLKVIYNPFNNEWTFALFLDNKLIDKTDGTGIKDLIRHLRAYFNVPSVGSSEYKRITESLNEWIPANKQAQNTSSTFYKDKFKKLLDHHIASLPKQAGTKVTSYHIDRLSEDNIKASFGFHEEHQNSWGNSEKYIDVYYYKEDKSWTMEIYVGNNRVMEKKGTGFNNLINALGPYMGIPLKSSQDYKDLLEWVDSKGNKITTGDAVNPSANIASSGYKKRFEKLIKYHINHASSELESITKKDIQDYSFHLSEHHNDGHREFDKDIVANVDKTTNKFHISFYIDGKEVADRIARDFKDFLIEIQPFMNVPSSFEPEYSDMLVEWMDAQGNKISSNSSSITNNTVTGSYKNRFGKLINYHERCNTSDRTIKINKLSNDTLNFTEHYPDGGTVKYEIHIEVATGAWNYKIKTMYGVQEDESGTGWENLLGHLRYHISIPTAKTLLYKDLLNEWVDAQGKKVTLGSSAQAQSNSKLSNRDKFIEITDFMKAHPGTHVTKAEVTRIDDSGFTYKELRSLGGINDITLAVNCNHSRFSDAWNCEIYRNNKIIEDTLGHGWPDLLRLLNAYFNAPMSKDPIYQKLLEWVDAKGNKINTSSSQVSKSTTKGGYWERFNKLILYHVNHKSSGVDKIVRTKVSKDGFHYTEHHRSGISGYDYDVVVKIDPNTESWTFQTSIDGTPFKGGAGNDYLALLKELGKHMRLPAEGSTEYNKLLTETYSSVVDDFRAYETLWS